MRTNKQADCAENTRTPIGAGDRCFLLACSVVFGAVILSPVWSVIASPWLSAY